jgi:hypothetical protein
MDEAWERPAFTALEVNGECTAYSGRAAAADEGDDAPSPPPHVGATRAAGEPEAGRAG